MKTHPFWFKATMILLGLVLLFIVLSYGQFVLMPLAFSALLAMLLNPVSSWIERFKVGRAASIIITLLLVTIVLGGIISLISMQFIEFAEQFSELSARFKEFSSKVFGFFEQTLGIAPEQQTNYLQQGLNNLIDRSGELIGTFVGATTDVLTIFGLLPIFIFFMIYYKEMYPTFFKKMMKDDSRQSIDTVIFDIQEVTQNYLVGIFIVIGIVAVLNSIGLLIIGIDHAIFFSVLVAVLAIIPYIGIIIGSIPPVLYALLFTDSLIYPIAVIGVFALVQFLEGNFITPNIIGSKVSINPFMAIIALMIGGAVWGIAGMILFVPLVGILRVVFKEIEELRPVGYLLGNTIEYDEAVEEMEEAEEEQRVMNEE